MQSRRDGLSREGPGRLSLGDRFLGTPVLGEAGEPECPHLLQLQLALPLPHYVALFQQLLLGLLKLFLPLEGRHKDAAEPEAPRGPEGCSETSGHQVALQLHPGSRCGLRPRVGAASGGSGSPGPPSPPDPRKGLGTLHTAMSIFPAPAPMAGITSRPLPSAYRVCPPIPDHWALAPAGSRPGMPLTGMPNRLAPWPLSRGPPHPTYQSPCLFSPHLLLSLSLLVLQNSPLQIPNLCPGHKRPSPCRCSGALPGWHCRIPDVRATWVQRPETG